MKVLLVGHDFDFSAGGGISRYANELYKRLKDMAQVRTFAVGGIPRPIRVFIPALAYGHDIVHVVYPDVAHIIKGNARMVTMWHDLIALRKFYSATHEKYEPKFVEKYDIAGLIIRNLVIENYRKSDAIISNSSMVMNDVIDYMKSAGVYDGSKLCKPIPLGVNEEFIKKGVWKGKREDFVYVGDIHLKHKNLEGLLHSFNLIASESKETRLHIFTRSPDARPLLDEKMAKYRNLSYKNVILHYRSGEREIIESLSHAIALLHLSKEEGFGLPILESMAIGTPAIVLEGSHIPGEVTKYAIKAKEEEVHEVALRLLQHPAPVSEAAVRYAKSFTWEKTAKSTYALYEELCK